jgi:hypothetical protein
MVPKVKKLEKNIFTGLEKSYSKSILIRMFLSALAIMFPIYCL